MNQKKYVSVSELNNFINNIFMYEDTLHGINVLGEVSQFKVYGQHAYFTIKDKFAEISCTCFNHRKTYIPKIGEKILLMGSVNFYQKKGSLSFNVVEIVPMGKGLIHIELEKLKQKLKEEGLFDSIHKKPIPQFPSNVCVITSINGAVIRDIVTTIRLRNNNINVKVYDARVQGDGAVKTIIKALKTVDKHNFDVIIIARGGGSLEDLMPFNNELLAREIFKAKTPIISAIGHETDFTISDLVADYRSATPTAAGELIAYNVEEWKAYIVGQINKISQLVNNQYNNFRNKVINNIDRMNSQTKFILEKNQTKVNNYISKMTEAVDKIYTKKTHQLEKAMLSLDNNSPLKLMSSGYFKIEKDNKPITKIAKLSEGDKIDIVGSDGIAKTEVVEILLEDKK